MAVQILQQPTTPNVTGTNLVYTLSSSNASNAQFRYVTDIYESGSGNYITTIKTFPNLSGNGILDVARELDDQLDYDYNWKVTGSIAPVESVKTFDLRFGEEYAPSYSGSITLYTGSTSNYLEVFPGEVYKNEGSYNFNTSSFDYDPSIPSEPERSQYLTNQPSNKEWVNEYGNELYMNSEDYFTVTQLKDVLNPGSIRIVGCYYDGNTIDCITGSDFTFPGEGDFYTFGLGPKNLADWSQGYADLINSGSINLIGSLSDGGNITYWIKDNLVSNTTFTGPVPCNDEYTRFAFINQYGFWDYYNVYNPLRSDNQVDRSIYERSFVRYEDSIGSYNISNRGNTQYRTEYDKRYITTTDFINKETSQWLTELFESPEVFVQQNGNFVPINITNTTIRWNMNQYREKLFQYDIEFKYANQPQAR
jgi:hypothetical protein